MYQPYSTKETSLAQLAKLSISGLMFFAFLVLKIKILHGNAPLKDRPLSDYAQSLEVLFIC